MFAPDHPSRFSGVTRLTYDGLAGPDAISIVEQRRSLVHLTARRGQQPALAAAIWQNLQLRLPQPGHSTSDGINTLIWVQPGSWLLQASIDAGDSLSVDLKSALASAAAVVDQSHGKSVLQLSGLGAREILARCCRLDLHPRVFGAGRCAATLVAHVPCILRQRDTTPCFDLIVASSFAVWMLDELQEASRAFGLHFLTDNAVPDL